MPENEGLGGAYLDHYARYLGPAFHVDRHDRSHLQVLAFDKVFHETMVFATLGLSRHASRIGHTMEVAIAVDNALRTVPFLLADLLLALVEQGQAPHRGQAVDGFASSYPGFTRRFGKAALYFTSCQGLPDAFAVVPLPGGATAEVLMAMFITAEELGFLHKHGREALENRFVAAAFDPFVLDRPSAV